MICSKFGLQSDWLGLAHETCAKALAVPCRWHAKAAVRWRVKNKAGIERGKCSIIAWFTVASDEWINGLIFVGQHGCRAAPYVVNRQAPRRGKCRRDVAFAGLRRKRREIRIRPHYWGMGWFHQLKKCREAMTEAMITMRARRTHINGVNPLDLGGLSPVPKLVLFGS